jgi:hypothetical protein
MSATMTLAPCWAQSNAVACPMPEAAPVTNATLPASKPGQDAFCTGDAAGEIIQRLIPYQLYRNWTATLRGSSLILRELPLLVGHSVEDRTRHVRGVADPLDAEERLANLLSDNVLPRLVPDLEVLPWRRTFVVAAQIYPTLRIMTKHQGRKVPTVGGMLLFGNECSLS